MAEAGPEAPGALAGQPGKEPMPCASDPAHTGDVG